MSKKKACLWILLPKNLQYPLSSWKGATINLASTMCKAMCYFICLCTFIPQTTVESLILVTWRNGGSERERLSNLPGAKQPANAVPELHPCSMWLWPLCSAPTVRCRTVLGGADKHLVAHNALNPVCWSSVSLVRIFVPCLRGSALCHPGA